MRNLTTRAVCTPARERRCVELERLVVSQVQTCHACRLCHLGNEFRLFAFDFLFVRGENVVEQAANWTCSRRRVSNDERETGCEMCCVTPLRYVLTPRLGRNVVDANGQPLRQWLRDFRREERLLDLDPAPAHSPRLC